MAPKGDRKSENVEGKPPRIVVASEPTELIVVAGNPEYSPLGDVDLLTLANADRGVIVEMASRKHYVLLSGRWFASEKELEGPWKFASSSELPAEYEAVVISS